MRSIEKILEGKGKHDKTLFFLYWEHRGLCKVVEESTNSKEALAEILEDKDLFESAVDLYYRVHPEPESWATRIYHKTRRGFLLENCKTKDIGDPRWEGTFEDDNVDSGYYWEDGREISYDEAEHTVKKLIYEICKKLNKK